MRHPDLAFPPSDPAVAGGGGPWRDASTLHRHFSAIVRHRRRRRRLRLGRREMTLPASLAVRLSPYEHDPIRAAVPDGRLPARHSRVTRVEHGVERAGHNSTGGTLVLTSPRSYTHLVWVCVVRVAVSVRSRAFPIGRAPAVTDPQRQHPAADAGFIAHSWAND